MATRQILIISNPDDEHTKLVVEKIRRLEAEPVCYYPEHLGRDLWMTMSAMPGIQPRIRLDYQKEPLKSLDVQNLSAIWYRRPRQVAAIEVRDDRHRSFVRDEWRAAQEGAYALLDRPLWVSHPDCLLRAARKPLQLKLAQEIGFTIPQTIITNDPNTIREFVARCNGKAIVKPTGNGWVYGESESDIHYVLTNRLEAGNLVAEEAPSIEVAPLTVQEEVPKDYELRIYVVGQEVLAIRIDSQLSERSALDCRRYDVANTPYTFYEMPSDLARQCLQLTGRLGLEYGAIDVIRRPDGVYVFLEINGNGQFLWAEELSGVSVSDALARLLAGASPPLGSSAPDQTGGCQWI